MDPGMEARIAHLEEKFKANSTKQFNILTTTRVKGFDAGVYSSIFVGRSVELQKISTVLNSIIAVGNTLGIRISGTGGVGKTHLIKYIQSLSKTKTIQQQLNLRDVKFIDCALIDAPQSAETFCFHSIYALIMEGLGKEDFFEELACRALHEFLLLLRDSPSIEIEAALSQFFGNGWRHRDVPPQDELHGKITSFSPAQFSAFIDAIKKTFRELERLSTMKQKVLTRNIFGDVLLLFETLGDYSVSEKALNYWKRADSITKSAPELDQDAILQFQRILAILQWIFGKILLIIAIDDLSHLGDPAFQERLFAFMKTVRNSTNHLCLLFSATHDEWEKFNTSIQNTDREGQLRGLFRTNEHYIDLDYLTDEEVSDWLSQAIRRWWNEINETLPPEYPWFPFDREAIYYLINCDHNDKTPRSIGNRLQETWKKVADGVPAGKPAFIRTAMEAWHILKHGQYFRLSPYEQKILLQFKKEKNLSVSVEKGIRDMFTLLRTDMSNPIREIINCSQGDRFTNPGFQSPEQLRIADVIVEFQSLKSFRQYRIEVQVKIKESDPVTLSELESSIDLLRFNITQYLIIMSFTSIDAPAMRALGDFPERVLYTTSALSLEQQAYCILLGKYDQLFHCLPSGDDTSYIFQKIFTKSP
jgi:hypothetical protein